jgi:putative transposase
VLLKSYKYRIYPTKEQKEKIDQHFGCCRLVWNIALAAKKQAWESNRINVSRYDLQKQLVDLKQSNKWLYDVNAQSLQSVLLNLDNSYKGFFKGMGFPRFKKKTGHQRFQCPQNVSLTDGLITIPKIKDISIVLSRKFEGKIKTVTISKTPTCKYFASILVEKQIEKVATKPITPATTLGVDVGIKSLAITSDGRIFEANRKLKDSLKRLQCLRRRASRKKKGSKNRKKANKCLAILHEKITNQRTDYIHKITTGLIRDNQTETIVIEDLNVVGMLKNRNLSQAISDVSFGEFVRQLTYKCSWYGVNLIKIGRFDPSSKRCSDCGEIKKDLALADREWTCQCGSIHDRDFNAAKNIKWFGLNNSRRGTSDEPVELSAIAGTKKQEKYFV